MDHEHTYLKIRAMLPPDALPTAPSARERNSLASTAGIVPFAGGTGTGAFGVFP